jgi:hypothetical protein
MAPVRRYLRITKYSVLEVRIYLDNPALVQTWLLHPRHDVLPRVIEAVRPLVLPKLREERERARKKSTRKKGIKDVVVEGASEQLGIVLHCGLQCMVPKSLWLLSMGTQSIIHTVYTSEERQRLCVRQTEAL